MKYTLIALAALTLFTGAASASDRKWPCVNLKANWMHAPPVQCPRIYIEGERNIDQPVIREVQIREIREDYDY